MAPDYPSDLIQDIKIRLRQAAGVPSYDPGNSTLGSFPYVADAVAALDPSLPDYLRCKRCHGGLLRGINSTLCIFCGAEQRGDGFSRTISFNYTAGYRRFLQSLDLDGSEVVNLEAESKESSRGKDSPKVGVTLSNILDLKLRWPREREEIDNSNSNAAPSQVALVSLSGVNLDNFFSDQKNEVSSRPSTSHSTSNAPQVSGHAANSFSVDLDSSLSVTRNETASNLSSRSQKFGFFERQKSLDVANSSGEAKGSNSDDGFADWETDFQSAVSATFEATAEPIDPARHALDFQNSNMGHDSSNDDTGGVLTHEVNHGTGEDLMHEADEAISRNDWFQSSKKSKETDQLDSIGSSIFVGELKNEEKETTSVKLSWTQDDLWQRSVNEIDNKSFNHHDDDLFDDWQDFATATNASVTSDKVHDLPSEANSGDLEDLEFGCFVQSDSFSSALNGLQSPNHVNTRQGGDSIAKMTNQINVSDLDASQYKVDMLLAQMPDLSFMLEESLSIPRNY